MSHEHRGDDGLRRDLGQPALRPAASEHAIPRWRIPDDEMLPETAYQIIHDELFLDGNARQNLATFVTTWMEPEAKALYMESFDKNMIDKDEYPQTAAIEERCLHILADLWNAPDPHATIGTSAIGSSEACMLAGLAFKRRWQIARRAARQVDRHAEHRVQLGGAGGVGEVRELLRGRAALRADHEGEAVPHARRHARGGRREHDRRRADPRRHLQRRVRTGEGARRRARRPAGAHRARHPDSRRRRVGRIHRAVPRSRPRVGLPRSARALDQRVGPQVRPRVPRARLGRVGEARATCPRSSSST